jgi:hypothetical protein
MSWTPLFSDIVLSSIWGEKDSTRVVWVTLLALKDRNGFVGSSLPGLARAANVGLEECREALDRLMAPDPLSRSKEYGGRRIEEAEGGWLVLNHLKYRDKISKDYRREYQRAKQIEYRRRRKAARMDGAAAGASSAVIDAITQANEQQPTITEANGI